MAMMQQQRYDIGSGSCEGEDYYLAGNYKRKRVDTMTEEDGRGQSSSSSTDTDSDSSSDSEDDDSSSSSGSSSSCEFIDLSQVDEEMDMITPLDCDEEIVESRLDLNDKGQMYCNVCEFIFKQKVRFIIHRRRHFAPDHFVCPTCFKGFVKLSHCQLHELKVHYVGNLDVNDSYAKPLSDRTSPAKPDSDLTDAEKEERLLSDYVVPSTSLFPYRGPEVTQLYEPYEIDLKFSKPERKMSTRNASKRTLDSQKKAKEETLRRQQNREELNRQMKRLVVTSRASASANLSSTNRPRVKSRPRHKKKIKFSKRREAVRVWEKAGESLTKTEFMSALGMIRKSDVLLGPRQGSRQIESSLFSFHRIRREKSPPPHARVIMEKLPPSQCQNRHVHICNICGFVAPTEKHIRRHRRSTHY